MNKIELTVFTPTYNREHTLTRLYNSLLKQSLKNFEWLIIDDGSIDETEKLVQGFIQEGIIPIRYIKQQNSGKQAAWNNAVMLAKGYLFCGIDSDDALVNENNIEDIFKKYIFLLDSNDVIGLRFLAYSNVKNTFDGQKLSEEVYVCSYFNEFSNPKNFGERIDVLKTEILKQFLYPVKVNTKFIPEIWFYVRVSNAGYKFAYIPEALRLFFDEATDNRLSRSSILRHAEGHYISRSTMLKFIPLNVFSKNLVAWLKTIIRFGQCANFLNKNFRQRRQDTNFAYALTSYISKFIKSGT
ncbi:MULTISPECIES: glycosyltransferase family 2 protein [Acinetobacter]|uniref:glycosyltransferase family 2 protein n=1 Tax=Acinetobacter TaxID=469 RepID=UPI0018DEA1D5|nr:MULTISPECIES: glycosyltransferase family 2 protein [Acinetobacter]MBI0396528.1 glycosyltransferase family 2 protein [Acinetobacter bereziniae]MBJ9374071.1 glycosyltransferase family 2 protein [Acinetobacter sp. TGL-Y2]MDQ9818695.1 glycosyltransferase family 2 protein [Acinetobacter bereziniae]